MRLYNRRGEIRTIDLRPNRLNIITGASKTGKSSIVEIVEYCFASAAFTVPVGVIRNTVSVYSLQLETPYGTVICARQPPANDRQNTTTMHVSFRNPELGPPILSELEHNANLDDAREFLSKVCGIEENETFVGSGVRPSYPADIRHALFFVLQAQNEVANPDILFHSQAEEWFPQSIRDVFPYFLGAVSRDYVLRRQELTSLEREIRKLRRQVGEDNALRIASGRVQGLVREAQSVGLIPDAFDPLISNSNALTLLAQALDLDVDADVDSYESAGQVADLVATRERLRQELFEAQTEASNLRALLAAHDEYGTETREQQARLSSLALLRLDGEEGDQVEACPVCESVLLTPVPLASSINRDLASIEDEIGEVQRSAPRVRELLGSTQDRAQSLNALLRENQVEIDAALAAEQRLERLRDLALRRSNVRGRIGLFLESVNQETESGLTEAAIQDLERRAEALRAELDPDDVRERVNSALSRIAALTMAIARQLSAEYAENPARLDLRSLSLIIDTDAGARELSEIGSGANWVAYHLALFLALQEFFIFNDRPVPRFLILDQPSQVYFPADHGDERELGGEDREALSRYFRVIIDRIASSGSGFQVLVLDHADLEEEWFQDAVIQRWRDGEALVPAAWINSGEATHSAP
ncbi:DUF3732 domain-containing protein [Actinomycetospora chlora]|uniref:DUF3732 domain-containing protein n=1 Tax=Actinomycetospora chlora TaxID=663608 RepID=UPI0031F03041